MIRWSDRHRHADTVRGLGNPSLSALHHCRVDGSSNLIEQLASGRSAHSDKAQVSQQGRLLRKAEAACKLKGEYVHHRGTW
jgi:hypothetical protein